MKKLNKTDYRRRVNDTYADAKTFCAYAILGKDGSVRRETVHPNGYKGKLEDHAAMIKRTLSDIGTIVGPVYGERAIAEEVIDNLIKRERTTRAGA